MEGNEPKELSRDQLGRFEARLKECKGFYGKGRRLWSFVHHSALFISIISSAAAAIIPQLKGFDEDSQKNIASILAALSALLLALSAAGGFERKWRANRIANGDVRRLETRLIARAPTTIDLDELNRIEETQDKEIIG